MTQSSSQQQQHWAEGDQAESQKPNTHHPAENDGRASVVPQLAKV
jgi:hypothetical protein